MKQGSGGGYRAVCAAALAFAFTAGCAGPEAAPAGSPGGAPNASAPAPPPGAAVEVTGAVQAFDQPSDGTHVTVSRAEIQGTSGYVLIHVDADGPDEVVGHAAIPEGESKDVVVTLDRKVASGAYWAMLHRDGGAVGTFEWPGPDGPVRPPAGMTYAQKRIILTVS